MAGKLAELRELQASLRDKPDDKSLIVQTRAAYLAVNREIAAQQKLYALEGGDEDFYGKVAEAVGGGITRDELIIYESLSGIRPYGEQAEVPRGLFSGDIKAFQLADGRRKCQCRQYLPIRPSLSLTLAMWENINVPDLIRILWSQMPPVSSLMMPGNCN
jgi:hypothetical protein